MPHDLTLLKHELYEMEIKSKDPSVVHEKAHEIAQEKYDYRKESYAYYADLNKHKKRKRRD